MDNPNASEPLGAPAGEATIYRIDEIGRIYEVNETWSRFAIENGAPELAGDAVLGRCFLNFFDDRLATLYSAVAGAVRMTGRPFEAPLRCDAPGAERTVQLTARALGDGRVEFENRMSIVNARDPVNFLDREARRGEGERRTCGHCRKALIDDSWVELSELAHEVGHAFEGEVPHARESLCPFCASDLEERIEGLLEVTPILR